MSSANIGELVDTMRLSIASEIEAAAQARISEEKRRATRRVQRAHDEKKNAQKRVGELASELQEKRLDDRKIVQKCLDDVNRYIRIRRKVIGGSVSVIVVIFASAPIFAGVAPVWAQILLGVFSLGFAYVVGYRQIWDRPIGLSKWLEELDRAALRERAEKRGLASKLEEAHVVYADHAFLLSDGGQDGEAREGDSRSLLFDEGL